jgi:hypothetical protein
MQRLLPRLSALALTIACAHASLAQDAPPPRPVEVIRAQAQGLLAHAETDLVRAFLRATAELPEIDDRTFMFRRSDRAAMTLEEAAQRTGAELEGFAETTMGEAQYYNLYSTPLAWARALDLMAEAGFTDASGARILDFGFGNVGQLRLLAGLGADVVGVEIPGVQQALYSRPEDQGRVPASAAAGATRDGSVTLAFGRWPGEDGVRDRVGAGFDLIMSKNTLKLGYIHPKREADPRTLIDLGVDDEAFVRALFESLNPGGFVLIYNLHPPQAPDDKPYIPWAYGESPFDRGLVERAGFEVVAWNVVDTPEAQAMGRRLGWDRTDPDNFEASFLAAYTILRRPVR